MDNDKKFEEWKITRSTIVEFDRILINIRALDVTATTILLGAGFQYSYWLFFFAFILNVAFLFLEIHYHRYLHAVAMHGMHLEKEIGFNLTNVIYSTRNKYKDYKKTSLSYLWGLIIANVFYIIYLGFITTGLILFILKRCSYI